MNNQTPHCGCRQALGKIQIMRYSSIFLFVLITHLTLFSGCECREHQEVKYLFTSKELEINPYNIDDRFYLKNLSGDSVQYLVSSRNSSKVKYFGSSDECDRGYYLYEFNYTRIDSKDNQWEFLITLSSYPIFQNDIYYNGIGFAESTNPNQSNLKVASRGLLYKNDSIYDYHSSSSAPILFHKAISIGPNSFNDIYEITLNLQEYETDLWVAKVFYSIKIGIVGYTTNKNETWYLDI